MQCPNCGTQNDSTYRFCMNCGTALEVSAEEGQDSQEQSPSQSISEQPQTYIPPSPPASTHQRQSSQISQQQYTASELGQVALSYGRQSISALNIWGPFAGYGTRRRHIGWLMDGRGDHNQDLTKKIRDKFSERQIPSTSINHETLVARGVIVESRPYFILRRGLVSIGLYIAQFGRDLFISLASYLKPPISNFRVLVLSVMVLFWLYMTFIFPNSLNNAADQLLGGFDFFGAPSADPDALFVLLCIVGPLGALNNLALFLFLLYSVYKWLTEKDFFAGLRVSPNEFNEDDLMALEKAVEQTVRISLDEIGLDPDDLKPTESFHGRRLI